MISWSLYSKLIAEGLWVESTSNQKIVWLGIDGWDFYYRISGVKIIQWHIMFYNPKYKLLYYNDEMFSYYCKGISLINKFKVSSNVFEITAIRNDDYDNTDVCNNQDIRTKTKPGVYCYFLEPPIIDPILNRYPVERICQIDSRQSLLSDQLDFGITDTDNLITDIIHHDETIIMPCVHKCLATKFFINCITVYSHEENFRFTIDQHQRIKCSICRRLNELTHTFNGFKIRLDKKETEFLLNY